jgi:hypothetical protein
MIDATNICNQWRYSTWLMSQPMAAIDHGYNSELEACDGDGNLHQKRMEDDEDSGKMMSSATGILNRIIGQAEFTKK